MPIRDDDQAHYPLPTIARYRGSARSSPHSPRRWTMPRGCAKEASTSTTCAASWNGSIPTARCARTALAMARRLVAAGISKDDRVRADRRDRPRIRRAVLRRGLCRRLAGAAAAADHLRRQGELHRAARGAAPARSQAAALSGRDRRARLDRHRPRAPEAARDRLEKFRRAPKAPEAERPPAAPDDICYLHGARAARPVSPPASPSLTARCCRLYGHATAMEIGEGDRVVSWLPWYTTWGSSAASCR